MDLGVDDHLQPKSVTGTFNQSDDALCHYGVPYDVHIKSQYVMQLCTLFRVSVHGKPDHSIEEASRNTC